MNLCPHCGQPMSDAVTVQAVAEAIRQMRAATAEIIGAELEDDEE